MDQELYDFILMKFEIVTNHMACGPFGRRKTFYCHSTRKRRQLNSNPHESMATILTN